MKRNYLIVIFITVFTIPLVSQTLNLPARNSSAYNGTQVISLLTPLSLTTREDSIFLQVTRGNVPDFIRNLVAVTDTINISGTNRIVTYYVTPDYMALGCDSDYFLCPMTPLLAQRIADYTGYSLPTRKMVNDIWQNATVKLAPQPIAPGPQMTTVPVFADHDSMVWASRSAQIPAHPLGELTGGDKKDVIISNHIYGNPAPGRVVIYGWHQLNGSPIQPLYYGHEETYADYSHGIRLVQNEITVDDCMTTIQAVLQSSTLNTLLSDEGAIAVPRYPVTAPAVNKPVSFCILAESPGNIRIITKPDNSIKGYNVVLSYDGKCFGLPTYYSSHDFSISSLLPDSIVFVKLAAVGNTGGTSSYSEVLGAFSNITNTKKYLVVNGFDRPTTGNTYDFIIQHGFALKSTGTSFSSATNEAITDSLALLSGYDAADYISGEESSANETFSPEEQSIVLGYLDSGGRIFVSGSETGWDLDHLGSAGDQLFYNNYLLSSYVEDAPNNQASTYYNATFTAPNNSPYSFTYDNGTHGTYDVRYPDVVSSISSGSWTGNPVAYFDAFPAKYAGTFCINKLVYLTIPFETIYPESSRNTILLLVDEILFFSSSAEKMEPGNEFKIYPNPAGNYLNVVLPSNTGQNTEISICNISGEVIYRDSEFPEKTGITIHTESFVPGIYFIHIKNKGSVNTQKFIIVR